MGAQYSTPICPDAYVKLLSIYDRISNQLYFKAYLGDIQNCQHFPWQESAGQCLLISTLHKTRSTR